MQHRGSDRLRYNVVQFGIAEEVLALGLKGAYLTLGGLSNRECDPEFAALQREVTEEVLADLSAEAIRGDPVLIGFRQLHDLVGRSNRKNVASPENLLKLLLKTGTLPRINLLVDIYNLVSIKTRLALGAHDLAKVSGNIRLRLTDGTEGFVPLGSSEGKAVAPGEYAYIDGDNDILCRLEVRQVEKTKVGIDARECFYIVQGNPATEEGLLKSAVDELIRLTQRFCGGQQRMLYTPWNCITPAASRPTPFPGA